MSETPKILVKEKILKHLSSFVVIFSALTTGLALFSYAVLGFYSRYYADDYCMSGWFFKGASGRPRSINNVREVILLMVFLRWIIGTGEYLCSRDYHHQFRSTWY